jgi:uncharacterized protein YfaS (alpha-2-macroglobulin family)
LNNILDDMNKFVSVKLTLWAIVLVSATLFANKAYMAFSKKNEAGFPGKKYDMEWKKVDSLENLQLTKQAAEQVLVIYNKAKADKNTPQIVKTLIYKLKYKTALEEDAYENYLADLDKEIAEADPVLKSILYSIKGELVWSIYQTDRWKINQRTVTDQSNESISSWDAQKFMDESRKNYMLSLQNEGVLKETKIDLIEDILVQEKTTRPLRPTLFDFLSHRALDHFMNAEANLNKPSYAFELDNPAYFGSYKEFIKLGIRSDDSLSKDLFALKLFKSILSFHSNSGYASALLDADLKRLEYVYGNYVGLDKEKLYLDALTSLNEAYGSKKESAEIKLRLAQFYRNEGEGYKPSVNGDDKKLYKKKAVELCQQIITDYKDSRAYAEASNLLNEIKHPSVSFTTENVLSPNLSNLMLLRFKNIDKAYFKLVQVNHEELNKKSRYDEKFKTWLTSQPSIKTWEKQIPNDGLYHEHTAELEIEPLKKGFYLLMVNDENDFSATSDCHYSPFFVSDLSYITRAPYGKGTFEAVILDRNSGAPVKGAEVKLFRSTYDYNTREYKDVLIANLKSNETGSVIYNHDSEKYDNFHFSIKIGDDFIYDESYLYIYKNRSKPEAGIYTSFFTDRGIYRPGQTVYFKGIKIKTDGQKNDLVTNTTTEVIFRDANYQEITRQKLSVNDFGSFQGSFVIPQGLATGNFHIVDTHGSKNISVEEYKRPKFEVTINKPTDVFRVNDVVKIKGNAKALAGFNITDAKVQYRVYRMANYPVWYRSWYPVDSEEQEITFGKTSTNDQGEFTIEFTAIPDKSVLESSDPTFNYRVSVEITDEAGETRTAEQNISAGYSTLTVSVNIPKLIDASQIKPWHISVQNLNGQEQKQMVNIKVEKLKKQNNIYRSKLWEKPDVFVIDEADFKKKFPNDVYKEENSPLLYAAEEVVYNESYNTADSAGFINPIKNLKAGSYRTVITTKDPYGKEVKTVQFFGVYNKKEKSAPVQDFLLTSVSNQVEPGNNAEVYVTSSENVKVLYEIEHDGKIIKKEWINLNNEQRVISIPILEEYRGNIHVSFAMVYKGRSYINAATITVPYTNKQLKVKLESFRDKMLPGSKEEWKLNVSSMLGQRETAELLLGMYDASLDAFVSNNWYLNVWNSRSAVYNWTTSLRSVKTSDELNNKPYKYIDVESNTYEILNWFGFYFNYGYGYAGSSPSRSILPMATSKVAEEESVQKNSLRGSKGDIVMKDQTGVPADLGDDLANQQANSATNVKARSNFNETAFFFPQIKTDADGNAIFSFTMPESLTKWKFMGLAHTKSLQTGMINQEMVTQKELMINTFAPRFLREGDELIFTGKITNLTEKELSGKAILELKNPLNDKNIAPEFGLTQQEITFSVKPGQSTGVEWKIKIPFNQNLVKYSVKAVSGNFSDGEENIIPILTNRMLVTETVPLWVNGNDSKIFNLPKINSNSTTERNHMLTLEFTSNPAWYAIQSLPYLMEYPYECAEQTFSRLYANSIATHIANSDPKIKSVFDVWKNYQPQALQSKLELNQELKNILLEESPWVREATNESERKRRVGILFDLNRMQNEIKSNQKKLFDMQVSNGGFPWFKGGRDDRYITQHIVTGFGKLRKLGITTYEPNTNTQIKRAVQYLDQRIVEDYNNLIKYKADLKNDNLSHIQIHYLYARSFFKDVPMEENCKKEVAYFAMQAKQYWNKKDDYSMGMLALALYRNDEKGVAKQIVASLKDRSIYNDELGMYWKGMLQGGYYWYNAPIETMALMIEAFDEVTADTKSVDQMRRWLLKNKQTNDWKTTKATADASYALLLQGTDLLMTDANVDISFKNGIVPFAIPANTEAGTGYFKAALDIEIDVENIRITKKTPGSGYGAAYWQYFEDMDKIKKPSTPNPLSVTKKLFREVKTSSGLKLEEITTSTKLETGDRIISRIILSSDRPMEYIHLKDMRASGLEPENVLSEYKYQQGLGYYESTRDVATHFFISYVPRGTFVFEYPSRVTHKGNFSNGITQVQCMYAPEFTFHSEGIRVNIK